MCREKTEVWFFSLEAASRLAVTVARKWFQLPYFFAAMSREERGGWIEYAAKEQSEVLRPLCCVGNIAETEKLFTRRTRHWSIF
jgi:uncharacterized protein YqjF (DUF2071 family)